MPTILQLVSYIVPATYYIDILSGIYLRDLGLSTSGPICGSYGDVLDSHGAECHRLEAGGALI